MSKASFLVLSHGIFITISFTLLRRIAHLDNLKIHQKTVKRSRHDETLEHFLFV